MEASVLHKVQVTVVPTTRLRPADWNPRAISSSQFVRLQQSLERDPGLLWSRPVLATPDGTIYAGAMRYRAAAALPASWRRQHFGSDGIPAVLEDVPLEFAKERALRDNNQWGEWDEQDLTEILHGLDASGVDVGLLGFTSNEVERLLAGVGVRADANDEGFDPTPPSEATSRPGDVYLLGDHRLVCGDAREPETLDILFNALEVDVAGALWTDPPYGVDLAGVALPSRAASADLVIEGDLPDEAAPLLARVFDNTDRRLAAGAPFYITGPHGAAAGSFLDAITGVGWHLAQTLVWVKNGFVPGRSDYHYQHEAIFYGWKRGAAHRWLGAPDQPTVIDDEPNVSRMRREELLALVKQLRNGRLTDVVREDKTRHNDLHPTMKPTALIRHLLANSTRRGDVVLDPFAGSGSTMVACELLGRRAVLIELEPRFCDVVAHRWTELAPGNRAELVRGG